MSDNLDLITRFYEAFAKRDATTMAASYADDATFSDPAFPGLDARGVRGMWTMLTQRAGDDFRVEFRDVTDTSAHWEAWYTFAATGKKVHNVIEATFVIRDGLIVSHTDDFDFHTWSKQALGLPGLLLGWTGLLQKKVQTTARGQLEKFLAKSEA